MSRAGYGEDIDNWALIRWRGRVASATRGKRGQKLLRELRDALDAMPNKELVGEELIDEEGGVCALGAVAQARGMDVSAVDPYDYHTVAGLFDIAEPLAREIVWENDEGVWSSSNAERWNYMRRWVANRLGEKWP